MTERREEAVANLLATLKTVSPSLETLIAERIALRREVRSTQSALADVKRQAEALRKIRDHEIPRYIGLIKAIAIAVITCSLAILAISLFTDLVAERTSACLFISLLIPLLIVDHAERQFGRWHLHLNQAPTFVCLSS